jgi:hypothetical protein
MYRLVAALIAIAILVAAGLYWDRADIEPAFASVAVAQGLDNPVEANE